MGGGLRRRAWKFILALGGVMIAIGGGPWWDGTEFMNAAEYYLQLPDGLEHGPFSESQVKGWIANGRADESTMAKFGVDASWAALGEFTEFAEALTYLPAGDSPSEKIARLHPLANVTLGLGICLFLFIFPGLFAAPSHRTPGWITATSVYATLALAGLVMGYFAWNRIREAPLVWRGLRPTKWGMILCGLAMAAGIISFERAKRLKEAPLLAIIPTAEADPRIGKYGQFPSRQLDAKELMAAVGANQIIPAENTWCDDLTGEAESLHGPDEPIWMGLNRAAAGRRPRALNPRTVVFFELEAPGWNVAGGKELLPKQPKAEVAVSFADGSTRMIPPGELSKLRWEP